MSGMDPFDDYTHKDEPQVYVSLCVALFATNILALSMCLAMSILGGDMKGEEGACLKVWSFRTL